MFKGEVIRFSSDRAPSLNRCTVYIFVESGLVLVVSTGITLVLSTAGMDTAAESASRLASLELLQAKRKILRMPVKQSTTHDL